MRKNGLMAKLVAGSLVLAGPLMAQAPPQAPSAAIPDKPAYGTFGFDVAGMDLTARPGEDFGRYANGTYIKNLVIAPDRSSSGMFLSLHDLSQERTRGIVEAAARRTDAKPGSEDQKVGDFFASFMDEAAIEAKGLAPLKHHLAALASISDKDHLAKAFAYATRMGVRMPLSVHPDQDKKNTSKMTVYVGQGGLGLPDRDYYLDTKNAKFAEIRAKYLVHVGNLLRLAGFSEPEARAKGVVALETRLAEVHWTKVETRQEEKTYNSVKAADLAKDYPGLDWTPFLTTLGVQDQGVFIFEQPSAIRGTAKLIASEPLGTWKDYLASQLLESAAPFLPKAFVDESFDFRGRVLSGQPENQPRWKRGVDLVSMVLGEAVGKLYVAKYFPPEAKAQADQLVKNVIIAMDARLAKVTWMDPATREQARAKLASFTPKIGYPSKWRDYSKLTVKPGDALGNVMRAREFRYNRELDKIGKPIDRTEWGMTPMTVNAYANFDWNEIVFPAAILQPPFFDPKADPAVNYGGIGAVIGHEISHHFDDQGRKYDKEGKLADWWTPEDVKRFTALTDKVVRQYGAYEPLPGSHVNGALTLGENMADLAGVNVALDAYHVSLAGKPAPVLDGLTGDQRFFLGFAQVWRSKYRDAALLQQVTTDPHTAGFLRPNVVRNLDAWYQAFGVEAGQALYLAPEDRIKVW